MKMIIRRDGRDKMEMRQLEIFRALAEELHFTRAAERVHCVQSNVTTQIRALEEELGTPLFDRPAKRVILTDAGRRFLPLRRKSSLHRQRCAGCRGPGFRSRRASVRRRSRIGSQLSLAGYPQPFSQTLSQSAAYFPAVL